MSMRLTLTLSLLAVAGASACAPVQTSSSAPAAASGPKNIIFLLGDGMGAAHVKAYRVYADDPTTAEIDALALDRHLTGAVATDSLELDCPEERPGACKRNPFAVTDSAASATAYATGRDTLNGAVGQGPDGERFTNVLEIAAGRGLGTGVVSTSQVTHASPASFVAHAASRGDYADIADQFLDNQVDGKPVAQVILGGGTRDLMRDDRNVASELVNSAGYTLVGDREALLGVDSDRVIGLFAPVGLPRHWDRPPEVPSLGEMTRKAMELLSRNEKGFFLMVEGSQVDWAAHGNDIVGVVSEMEGFVEAIDVALAFAEARDDTLVVVTADHETGGLSLGAEGLYEWTPVALRGLTATPAAMVPAFLAGDDPLSEVVSASVSFELTDTERRALDAAAREPGSAYSAINQLFDRRTRSGWTTEGHTGVDVPLFATGPGAEAFDGVMRNEAVGRALIDALPE